MRKRKKMVAATMTAIMMCTPLFNYNLNVYATEKKDSAFNVKLREQDKTKDITTLEGNVQGVNGNWERTSSFKQLTRNFYDNSVYAFYTPKWKNEITFNNPIGGKTTGTSNNKNNNPLNH